MAPIIYLSVLLLMLAASDAAAQTTRDQIARGKYVFGAAAGCGCHTVAKQPLNAGGRKYDGPFGTVYSSNITPDRASGIGKWTDEQIITATRSGRRPNGERLIPVHPYTVFNGMAEQDLKDVVAYLRSVPPINRATPAKKISVPMFESVFLPAWLATFAAIESPPKSAATSGVARGEYLTRAVSHCGECHTPRALTMAVDNTRVLAGNPKGGRPARGGTMNGRLSLIASGMVVAGLVIGIGAGCAGKSMSKAGSGDVVADRQRVMKLQGASWADIQAKAKAGNIEGIAVNAETLALTAQQIPGLFPEGSLTEKSKAKPEVWQKRAEFDAAAKNLEAQAEKLRDAARAKNEQLTQDLVKDFGRQACGTCHTPFRQPPPQQPRS